MAQGDSDPPRRPRRMRRLRGWHMPRYYFHVQEGLSVQTDMVGAEMASLDEAYAAAVAKARRLMRSRPLQSSWPNCAIRVIDASGELVMLVPFPLIAGLVRTAGSC